MFLVNWFWPGVLATAGARRAGAGECVAQRPGRGHAAVPRRERAVPRRGCGARHPGLLALRSANGLGPARGYGRACPDSVQPGWWEGPGDQGTAAQGYLRGWSSTCLRARRPLIGEKV